MSELDGYEIEDFVWQLSQNDDHIVPHTKGKKSGVAAESDRSKRARVGVKCNEIDADRKTASDGITHRKDKGSFSALKEDKEEMLEKDTWSHSSRGGFPDSFDGNAVRKTSCSTPEEGRMSDQRLRRSNMDFMGRDLCGSDASIGDQTVAMGSLYPYQLNNASHTENDLAVFGSTLEDEESNDLLYYGWPDLENFEDVDNIFRTCDSTFGVGIDNNDELGWFSSANAVEGSDDTLKSTFDFPEGGPSDVNIVSKQQESCGLSSTSTVTTGTEKLLPVSCKSDSLKLIPDSSSVAVNSFYNGSAASAHRDTQSQGSHVSPSKPHEFPEGKSKERSVDNGVSFIQINNLNNAGESNHLLNTGDGLLSENYQRDISHQTCLDTPVSLIKPDNSHPSHHVLPESSQLVKFKHNGLVSISPRGSSHASNRMQSHDISLQTHSFSAHKEKGRPNQGRLHIHTEKGNLKVQKADPVVVCSDKAISNIEDEAEGQSEVCGSDIVVQGKLDSSNMQESSCMSSVVDDVSVDSSSLHQLQHVMEQLDIRTKMCIRDSLYRLAKSAEQRHKCGGGDNEHANGPLLSDGTNKCAGFIDMETDTNPIDRSIAHLLFHRPLDRSAVAASSNAVAMKPPIRVPNHGLLPPEKPICGKETTSTMEEVALQRP